MNASQALVAFILVATLVVQAFRPASRILVVTSGAATACAASSFLGLATTKQLLADVPWDVIVILVALGLLTELFVASRVFGVLAVASARWSAGSPARVLALSAVGMYLVSCFANNLTALLLALPILLIQLKLMGVDQRFVSWTIGLVLVSCNLGGAATPIGDFPAILLLGRGSMGFLDYLANAAPPTVVALGLVLGGALLLRPGRTLARDPIATRLSLSVVQALYRNVCIDRAVLLPPLGILAVMLVAWLVVPASTGATPELICWLGVAVALGLRPRLGERLIRTRVDAEAVLFLLSLFVMVAAVRRTGLFETIAAGLLRLPLPPLAQLVIFLVLSGVLTGLFSAGPSMAAMLDVAEHLVAHFPKNAVYVGLALSVCAGSSLFITAATSGPMAQALTERADLRDEKGEPLRFGFFEFLPVGLLAFAAIQVVAIGYALLVVALA